MKILISSYLFYPSVGGIETASSILAYEFLNRGHEVKLITQSPATDNKIFPFEVVRQPKIHQLFQLVNWCDVFFHNNISLSAFLPLLLIRKPWIVTHQTWITRLDGSFGWQDRLKRFLLRFASCISISQAVAEHLSTPSIIIGNPYRDDLFYKIPEISQNKELVFLGRLVSDKGVDLLIEALGQLKKIYNLSPRLTIVGQGPEEKNLRNLVQDLDLEPQIDFVGIKTGTELVQLLNAHQIMVVPSRWLEPLGIVALEGIACGCVVVGSEGGGLKDAIGSCGVTFKNGDTTALSQVLFNLITNPDKLSKYRAAANVHLSRYQKNTVAKAYLKVFEEAIK